MKQTKRAELEKALADAERRAYELRAQLASTLGAAFDAMPKAQQTHFYGGGVILRIDALGGAAIVAPVMIRDGLSAATVEALQDDL